MTQKKTDDPNRYDDIIGLPHHVSASRPHMAVADRAAQFLPFAALTGYESAVRETARLTDRKIELDEDEKEALNQKLLMIKEMLNVQSKGRLWGRTEVQPVDRSDDQFCVTITYFIPDEKKEGGQYATVSGSIKKISEYENNLILRDGTRIPLDDIAEIDGEIFRHAMR